jgi:hypothetical protein
MRRPRTDWRTSAVDIARNTRPEDMHERAAVAGELCKCGRPAVVVFMTDRFGAVGQCGLGDGGGDGPCPFCGDERGHKGERCSQYRLSVDSSPARRPEARP